MNEMLTTEALAAAIPRIFLGILFFFQGYDAIFKVGLGGVYETFRYSFEEKGIPSAITKAGVWFTSLVQITGGALLITGLLRYYAMAFLGLDLLLASLAFSIAKPMWDTAHVFTRLTLLVYLLLIPMKWDAFSLDAFIK